MSEVKINLTGAMKAAKPADPGAYPVLVKKCELKKPKQETDRNGNKTYPYFSVQAEITDGPFAGKKLFATLTTNPEETSNGGAKNFMLLNFLKVLDMDPKDEEEAENFDVSELQNAAVNVEMVWTIDIDPNEETRNRVIGFSEAM